MTTYFLKGRKMQLYAACCETVLALPPGPACVHHSGVSTTEAFLGRRFHSPSTYFSVHFRSPWLSSLSSELQKAHPQGSPSGVQGSGVSWYTNCPPFHSLASVTARTGHWRPAQAMCKEQWLCNHQARAQTQILTRSLTQGLGLLFSCCFQGASAQNHIFVLPVPNEALLGQLGESPLLL